MQKLRRSTFACLARRQLLLSFATAAMGATAMAQAQTASDVDRNLDALFGSHAPFKTFFETLQRALAADDRKTVADMIDYPFHTRIAGKAVTITNAAGFVDHYDGIVTTKVKRAIAEQSYATLFANWQGMMIGDGEVWFAAVGKPAVVRITAINH